MRNARHHDVAIKRLAAGLEATVLLAGFAACLSEDALAGSASAQFQVGITILPSGAKPTAVSDPLAGSAWSAVDGPWLGTLGFAARGRMVHVAIAGAAPEDVSYSLVATPPNAAGQGGELHILSARAPDANFFYVLSADGRAMTLIAARTGARGHYVRAVTLEP